jgi:hypothetical protein
VPRRTRSKAMRKQVAIVRCTAEKSLRGLKGRLVVEWRTGQTAFMDTVTTIRAAEQWHARRQQRLKRRLRQDRAANRRGNELTLDVAI